MTDPHAPPGPSAPHESERGCAGTACMSAGSRATTPKLALLPTRLRRCVRASCVVLLAIGPGLAEAEPQAQQTNVEEPQPAAALALKLQGPRWLARCLTAEKLATSVSKQGIEDPATELAFLNVEVDARAPVAHETSLEIRAHQGERSLGSRVLEVDPRDCAALPDAVGLVVVLLARAGAATAAEEARQAAPVTPADAAGSAAKPSLPAAVPPLADFERLPPLAAETPSAAEPMRLALGTGASGVSGVMPGLALRLHLEAALIRERLGFRLRVGGYWPKREPVAEGSVGFAAGELSADACLALAAWAAARSGLHACVGPRAGLIRAVGRGFRLQNNARLGLRVSAGALLALRVAIAEATALRLEGGASLALLAPRLLVQLPEDGEHEVSSPGLVSAELGLSIEQVF